MHQQYYITDAMRETNIGGDSHQPGFISTQRRFDTGPIRGQHRPIAAQARSNVELFVGTHSLAMQLKSCQCMYHHKHIQTLEPVK